MILSQHLKKVKSWMGDRPADFYIAGIIMLASITSFGLGRLSVILPIKTPIRIEGIATIEGAVTNNSVGATSSDLPPFRDTHAKNVSMEQGKYVASKNGTAYHYSWCIGAQRIKNENKIWFSSKEDAEKAGYKPAGNCPGL